MPGTDDIAGSLARYRADHGARTVLVYADGTPAPLDAVEGDIESVAVRWSLTSESGGRMREVFPVDDTQDVRRLGMEHLGKLVASLRGMADLVVIRSWRYLSRRSRSWSAPLPIGPAGRGSSSADSVAARDQMERAWRVPARGGFVERPRRHRAEAGSVVAPRRAGAATDQIVGSRAIGDAGHIAQMRRRTPDRWIWAPRHRLATAPVTRWADGPAAGQVTTEDTGDETVVIVNAWSPCPVAGDRGSLRVIEGARRDDAQCRPAVTDQPDMIKRIAPGFGRRGRAGPGGRQQRNPRSAGT
jgi:hypothetical protein